MSTKNNSGPLAPKQVFMKLVLKVFCVSDKNMYFLAVFFVEKRVLTFLKKNGQKVHILTQTSWFQNFHLQLKSKLITWIWSEIK